MARGAFRGAAGACLGLIVLQAVTTNSGSGKVAGALDVLNGLVKRALDPDVAGIPDHASPALPGATAATTTTTPRLNANGFPDYNVPVPGAPNPFVVPKIPVPQI